MTLRDRFNQKWMPDPDTGCWMWTASTNDKGYGQIAHEGRPKLAHRVSWALHCGPVPSEIKVLHECDNPPCVNPRHLFLGTQLDNIRDCIKKGRKINGPLPCGEMHQKAKLTDDAVRFIRANRLPLKEIQARFGVSKTLVLGIRNGSRWKHVQ